MDGPPIAPDTPAPPTAYDRIRLAIIEGRYRPGEHLVEQRIAAEFSLSRTPVREALRRLEAEGLVQGRPNRGAVVREVSAEEIADLYDLRARLEGYAAELAAQRRTEADIAGIDGGIAAFASAMEARGTDAVAHLHALDDANKTIHDQIKVAARHPRLLQILARTVDIPLVFQTFRRFAPTEVERSHLFHQLIRDAIVAGDTVRAGSLMEEHVRQGRDVLIASLDQADPPRGATDTRQDIAGGNPPARES